MAGWSGRKAFVTGGSSGIGLAVAKQLVLEGADVVIAARGAERLDAAVVELRAVAKRSGQIVDRVSVDVTDRAAVRKAAEEATALLGSVDLLIANSGFARTGTALDLPDEAYDVMIQTNYMGHVNVVRAFLPHMVAQRRGHIALVTSMLGFMSFYGYSAYAASKFAIVGFAESLRQEMLPHGVEVSIFYPPTTDTPGLEEENRDKPPETWAIEGMSQAFTAEDVAKSLLVGIAGGRFVQLVGMDSWLIYTAYRFIPGVVRWVLDFQLKRHLAKKG